MDKSPVSSLASDFPCWRSILICVCFTMMLTGPALAQDTDGDGVDDNDEVMLGSNPLDDQICPQLMYITHDIRLSKLPIFDDIYIYYPSLAWTGSEFGISWSEDDHGNGIYFTRISEHGDTIGPDIRLTLTGSLSSRPSLVWTGSEYGISWIDDGSTSVNFLRLSTDGTVIGDRLSVSDATYDYSENTSLVWTGTEFGVSWNDYRGRDLNVYFTRISADGTKIGIDLRISYAGGNSGFSVLVWADDQFGLCWKDHDVTTYDTYFSRISSDGIKMDPDLLISTVSNFIHPYTSITWSGSEFGITWGAESDGDYNLYFTRVSKTGDKIGDNTIVNSNPDYVQIFPFIIWTGSKYGLTWLDYGRRGVFFTEISREGEKELPDFRITNSGWSEFPSIIWTGNEYGISWNQNWGAINEIFFKIFEIDQDGDSISGSDETHRYFTNPIDWDTDDDELSDGDEIYNLGTNPYNEDTDADGMNDGDELLAGRDPLFPDSPAPSPGRSPFGLQPGDNDVDGPFGIKCAGSVLPGMPSNVLSSILLLILPGIAGLGLRSLLHLASRLS